MIDARSRAFFGHFMGAYPSRSLLMVVLLAVAGLAEGVGVLTLVPVLELANTTGEPSSDLGRVIVAILETVGLQANLATLLTIIVGAITAKALLLLLALRQVGYTVAMVTRDLRLKLIRALLKARWRYFGSQASGQFANTVSSEAIRAASAYREACQVLAALFQIAVYVTISALISWRITLLAIASGILLVIFLRRFVQMSRDAGEDQTRLTKSLAHRLVDVIQGIKPLKAMAREDLVWPLLRDETEGLNQAHRRQVLAAESLRFFQEPILTLLLAIGLFVLLEVSGQPLSAVLILAFIFYRLMRHVNTLQMRYQVMVVGESAFWSLKEQIDEAEAEREPRHGGEDPGPIESTLVLRNLSFAYDERAPVLEGVDLEIPRGRFVAVTGESGSGKTTLADLVVGLHQPDEGEILVDGRPLRELDLDAWRRRIGYVPQELLLFNDTVLQNVTLGDEELSRQDAERALRLAGAWDFVAALPDGMDSRVGDKGGKLSGGQRQRIAIARALAPRPSLLILDEVTTALDPATEQAICETLRGLRGEVTILSISHQPALREAADEAWIMRDRRLEPLRRKVPVSP